MARTRVQEVRFYSRGISSTDLLDSVVPESANELVHQTRLPGGFHLLQIRLRVKPNEYAKWRDRPLARVKLEGGGTVNFEGRIESLDLVDSGLLLLTCRGYYRAFAMSVDNNATYSRNYSNKRGDEIIKDMLDNGFHADADPPETTNQNRIENPGHTGLTVNFDTDHPDWSLWRVLTDANQGVLKYGDSNDKHMDFAVWEDGVVHYSPRDPTSVDWIAYLFDPSRQSVKRFPSVVDVESVATAVGAVYDNAGTLTQVAYATDAAGITEFSRIEKVIPNLGPVTATNAQEARDSRLEETKDWNQRTDSIVLTRVFDENGVERPLCDVRAGDVLRIADWRPTSQSLGIADLDRLRSFVVLETRCDHVNNELTIRPDFESRKLTARVARAGLE